MTFGRVSSAIADLAAFARKRRIACRPPAAINARITIARMMMNVLPDRAPP
jgi:hypothetical protein